MGMASNQTRLMALTARQHDLELRAQQISQGKIIVSASTTAIANKFSTDINAAMQLTDEIAKKAALETAQSTYNASVTPLSNQEKMLDMELTQINTEHTAVKTEYDAVKTLIGDNTEKSFNVFG